MMPHLCQRTLSKQRISNTYKPPRLPLAADRLFFMNRANYVVAVDYFSRYFEINPQHQVVLLKVLNHFLQTQYP